MLSNFTQQGITNIEDGPERAERFRQAVEAVGGTWVGGYLTLGRYGLVGVIQVPDATAIAQLGLRACASGNIRTETLRAFPREEMQDIIAGLR
jgi:uncharacterized protein with GYD domain